MADEASTFGELFTRLGSVETGLAAHIASCTERRDAENEERVRVRAEIKEMKQSFEKFVAESKDHNSEQDKQIAKLGVYIAFGTALLVALKDVVLNWIQR